MSSTTTPTTSLVLNELKELHKVCMSLEEERKARRAIQATLDEKERQRRAELFMELPGSADTQASSSNSGGEALDFKSAIATAPSTISGFDFE
jgi:hypothetical protein